MTETLAISAARQRTSRTSAVDNDDTLGVDAGEARSARQKEQNVRRFSLHKANFYDAYSDVEFCEYAGYAR